MSLMQLLAVGRTLNGIRDESHRYRDITGKNLLPRFGVPNRQQMSEFKGRALAAPAASTSATARTPPNGEALPLARVRTGAGRAETTAKPKGSSLAAFVHGQRGRWFVAKSLVAKSAVPSRPTAHGNAGFVGGKLSLDKVIVVRNDLSDADLEVVPALRPGPMGREESTSAKAPKRDMVSSVWSRATASFFAAMPF